MSRTIKIVLAVAVLAAVGIIFWRRRMAGITDEGSYSPSHNVGAASTGQYGSTSTSPTTGVFGSAAKTLQDAVSGGILTQGQAASNFDGIASGYTRPGFVPKSVTTYVPPSTGPTTETRTGRGHF